MPAARRGAVRIAPWDIVVAPFPYSDRLAEKRRPALVISSGELLERHQLIWAVMVTSASNPRWASDVTIKDHEEVGLPAPSLIRPAKIASFDPARVIRVAGRLGSVEQDAVRTALRRLAPL